MPRIKLSRREWALFLFPCSLLLLSHLDKFRALDSSRLALALNPLGKARENARSLSCQSNLKQISLGLLQYAQDYDGRVPLSVSATSNWVHLINPYTKSCPILRCPSDGSYLGPSPMIPSYWMNSNLGDSWGRGLPLKQVDRPERTFLFGDWSAGSSVSPYTLNEKSWKAKAPYAERHLFGANYAFTDGHVKWYSSDDIRAFQLKDPCCTLHSWRLKVLK